MECYNMINKIDLILKKLIKIYINLKIKNNLKMNLILIMKKKF